MRLIRHPLRARILGDFLEEQGLADSRGAELGVLQGKTLFYLADRFPRMELVGVDAWEHRQKDTDAGGRSYSQFDLPELYDVLGRAAEPYGRRVRLIRSLTAPAADRVADRSLDWVFIDADHTYEGVFADVRAWRPKVRPGGWLMGHDCTWPSVERALEELLLGWARLSPCESIWICRA